MTVIETAAAGYRQQGWDLSELVGEPVEAEVGRLLQELRAAVEGFEAHRGGLASDVVPGRLLEVLADYEAVVRRMYALSAYGLLRFSADTQSSEALTLRNRVDHELTEAENRILFFPLWWKGLDDGEAERLLPEASAADARHFLVDLRRFKPFALEERAEQIVNLKDANGVDALLKLYSMLTNRLEFRLEVDGEVSTLTRDQVMSHAFSPRGELRAAAYRELLRVYREEATVLGEIYLHRVRDWDAENRKLRRFDSPIAVRNVANDIPDGAVDALLDVVRANCGLFQRYFRLKAGWLGLDRLRRFDIYAPLGASDRRVPYDEAVASVLDTFSDFHPDFAARAERVFRQGHIDSEVRKGKRSGAFCATVLPEQTPWLLVNYTGRVRDVATLAHELGHAVHSLLAEEHSALTQHPSLPLAETASVFAEMLLTDRLLGEERDPAVRRELLAAALDDVYGTVQRQAYFVRFEQAAHAAILAGKPLDDLHDIYFGQLVEHFGDSVEIDPEFRYEWLAIPHLFHSPFYCYSYSFGQLLVLALYRRYQEEGPAFVPGYLQMLAHGGSARPARILAEVGIDMTDPAFWQGGFAVVEGMLDDLAGLESGAG